MNRSSEALFLKNSPLVFTLGVCHFDPVLAIGNYIPTIQEFFRKHGYPKVRERQITASVTQQADQTLLIETRKQWEFHSAENTTSFLVDQESVIVQTTDYSTYENFEGLLDLALQGVTDLLDVPQILRCGLRYVDAIDFKEGQSQSDLLQPFLLGYPGGENFSRVNSSSMTQLESTEGSKLFVRCSTHKAGIVLPPDLLPCDLAFKSNPSRQTPFSILDLDHFSQTPFDYDRATTLSHLSVLHDSLDIAFRSSVTPQAIEQWKTT